MTRQRIGDRGSRLSSRVAAAAAIGNCGVEQQPLLLVLPLPLLVFVAAARAAACLLVAAAAPLPAACWSREPNYVEWAGGEHFPYGSF